MSTSALGARQTAPTATAAGASRVNSCEQNIAKLEEADLQAGKHGIVIAIARLGKAERSNVLNRRRLHNVWVYLNKFLGRKNETIVLAQGAPIQSSGRVEIYVNGKMLWAIEVGFGEDLAVGSCDGTDKRDALVYDSRRRKNSTRD